MASLIVWGYLAIAVPISAAVGWMTYRALRRDWWRQHSHRHRRP